jgi:hypothetical protein
MATRSDEGLPIETTSAPGDDLLSAEQLEDVAAGWESEIIQLPNGMWAIVNRGSTVIVEAFLYREHAVEWIRTWRDPNFET